MLAVPSRGEGTVGAAATRPEGLTWIEGKDERLEVLSERPLVLATPTSLLAGHRITDTHTLFVRNIQDLDEGLTFEPLPIEGWEIELVGLNDPSRLVVHAEELLEMEQVEHEMVLQCSGRRSGSRWRTAGRPGTSA